jgi:hypothetical protein
MKIEDNFLEQKDFITLQTLMTVPRHRGYLIPIEQGPFYTG